MEVKLTRNAHKRLAQVLEYHKTQGNPKKGKRTVLEIIKHSIKLGKQPNLGSVQEEMSSATKTYRALVVNRYYKVIYRAENERILIVEIFDVRQDPSRIKLS